MALTDVDNSSRDVQRGEPFFRVPLAMPVPLRDWTCSVIQWKIAGPHKEDIGIASGTQRG
jgi:hypothetical protein